MHRRGPAALAPLPVGKPAETAPAHDPRQPRGDPKAARYISVVLAPVAQRERERAISKRVDEVLADLDGQDDLGTVNHLHPARREEGTEW